MNKINKGDQEIAEMLGIKISKCSQENNTWWEVVPPIKAYNINIFNVNQQSPYYKFKSKKEVEAFLAGYSLVIQKSLKEYHTPQKEK